MAYSTPWVKSTGIVQVKSGGSWVSLVDPTKMTYNVYDLDAGGTTGRNLEGDMLRDRVGVKEKLEMEFPMMYASDLQQMLSLTSDQFFEVKFYSIKTGATREAVMYVGDREGEAYFNYDSAHPGQQLWTEIKFNFIER